MEFIIKVPGLKNRFKGYHASAQAAQKWAEVNFPEAHPASVRCVRGEA